MITDITKALLELQKTGLPNLLVIAGLIFIFLSFVGKVGAVLELPPNRQKVSAVVGVVLLLFGVSISLIKDKDNTQNTPTSTPSISVANLTSTTTSLPSQVIPTLLSPTTLPSPIPTTEMPTVAAPPTEPAMTLGMY
jgi:hypothetical protein